MTTFYDFSGGMESAAMLVLERNRIRETSAIVRWADTGRHFPEMGSSIEQIESVLSLKIAVVPRRIDFDEFLFDRGGIIRKGTNDCSRRMKRSNLSRHMKTFPKNWEVNLGFNAGEVDRADAFTDRNERPWCHWRFPLIETGTTREATVEICKKAGFTILISMYEKMGRFDCYMCGNQTPAQALKVHDNYPDLSRKWMEDEERKGHSFLPIPLKVLVAERDRKGILDIPASKCACFGGTEDVFEEENTDDLVQIQAGKE